MHACTQVTNPVAKNKMTATEMDQLLNNPEKLKARDVDKVKDKLTEIFETFGEERFTKRHQKLWKSVLDFEDSMHNPADESWEFFRLREVEPELHKLYMQFLTFCFGTFVVLMPCVAASMTSSFQEA